MISSYYIEDFEKAIREKDCSSLRLITVNAIRNDSAQKSTEVKEMLQRFHRDIPEIFEAEKALPYEERMPEEKWDYSYFIKLTYFFQENFAESRLKHIWEVGRKITPKPQKEAGNKRPLTQAPLSANTHLKITAAIAGGIFLAGIAVLIIVLANK